MALDFVAGCLGGCAGILVGHPLDTVKVHLQTQNQRKPAYRGALDCFGHIIHRESVWGLYRGMGAPLAGVAAVNAVTFGVYGLASRCLGGDSLRGQFLAGALSGLAQAAICAPLEQLKTRAQLLGVGPLQCAADVLRREGPRGLFRGLAATVLRDTPAMGIYFATYEAMTRGSGSGPAPTWLVLAAGGTAGAASWVFTYPVDVLKSRLQADGADGRPRRYSGMADCLRQSVRSDGWPFLTRGLAIVVVRAFPTNAACFFTVTMVLRWDQERRRASASGRALRQLESDSSLLQLQPPRAATAWFRRHLDDIFGWRRSLARASACSFLKLEGPAAHGEGQGEPGGANWSRLQYESVHRLFLHTADFTESSWLSSAEFLSPPEGEASRNIESEQLEGPEYDELSSAGAGNLWEGSGSEMVQSQSGVASSTSEPVQKLDPKSDDVQIMGNPASGLVRKPDAVRHIRRDDAKRTVVTTRMDLFQGYIVPPTDLWLYRSDNHLEHTKLTASRPDKSRSSND